MAENRKRRGYDSMDDTDHQDTVPSAPPDGEDLASTDSESVSQATPAYRVVVVGRAGCRKSTICNALLNSNVNKFNSQIGMGPSTRDFQSEINEDYKLHVVDAPDVFSMGYTTEEAARNKFKEVRTLTPSGIPTAFLFPIPLEKRFTPAHYHLCHKYLQLLPEPYTNNIILVLIKANPEMTDDNMKETSLPKLLGVFGDRVIRLNQLPSEREENKAFINDVMGHLRTMKPLSLESRRSGLCLNIISCFVFIWRHFIRPGLQWLCRVCQYCRCCPTCPCCHCRSCCDAGNDTRPLRP
ncbi:GTPase IMAP family member 4-like [Littorina saxatilis]|uniref:AIG1-type G domain-containing protein n=1 Tax=Littorina saxatilis TaxID=31220 RepID=A0AAN9B6F0_9CAEN